MKQEAQGISHAENLKQRAQPLAGTLPLPPGPKGSWLWGSMLQMAKDPLAFHLQLAREYGDIVRYRALFWGVVLVNTPDGVRHVLQDNNKNYDKQNQDYKMLKPMVGEGLLTSDGSLWLRQRRMIQPIFNRRRIASFGDMMVRETQQMLQRWQAYLETGESFDLAEEIMRLTLTIAGQTLFSLDLSQEAEGIGRAVTVGSRRLGKFDLYSLIPRWLPLGPNREYQQAMRYADTMVHQMIQQRRQEISADPEAVPQDLLTLLLQAQDQETGTHMDDKQVRDEVVTLLVAGHETTALALSWTWYLLAQHPEVAASLYEEIDRVLEGRPVSVDDLPRLPYTLHVLEESMRLYPPAWGMTRNTIADDEIGGYRIPKGAIVMISPYTLHRHPDWWQRPEQFWPEHFTPENIEKRPKYAYFPFGGGPRLCIGKHMAMMESQLVLATMAQHIRMQLDPSHHVELEPLITLRPKTGIRVMAQRRKTI